MCGIAGILLAQSEERNSETIQDLFTANLLANETRGKEATGALIVQKDSSWFLEKALLPASEFIKTQAYAELLSRVNKGRHCSLVIQENQLRRARQTTITTTPLSVATP